MLTKQLTVVIKTIHRPMACNRLIQSLDEFHPGLPIHVLDDGKPRLRLANKYPDAAKRADVYIETKFDIGLSAGRNELLQTVTTPYFLLLDDDHVITPQTKLADMVNLLNTLQHECEILGFRCPPRVFHADQNNDSRVFARKSHHYEKNDVLFCDATENCFVAKTDAVKSVLWDPELKVMEHWEFFYRFRKQGMRAGTSMGHRIRHAHVSNRYYRRLRRRKWLKKVAMQKHGLTTFVWGEPRKGIKTEKLYPMVPPS